MSLLAIAGAILLIAQTPPTSAQSSDTIPREFMELLLTPSFTGREGFDLRIGPPPAGFPADLLPENAVIAASAISPIATTVVGTVDQPLVIARPAYEARLAAAGWVTLMPAMRGFTSAVGAGDMLSICRGNDFATATLSNRKQGGTYLKVTLRTDPRQTCVPRANPFFADVTIPVLRHPHGAKAYGGGGGGSADTTDSRAFIESPIDAAALLSHYADQMTAAGWSLVGQLASPEVATVARFSSTTTRKEPISAILTITRVEPGAMRFDLSLRIFRHSR